MRHEAWQVSLEKILSSSFDLTILDELNYVLG
jgi:ATP:corrinoid adenosyltransferase